MTCRILLCDDCADYRVLQRAVLEPAGAQIVGEASDGRECLSIVADADPDLILLDVNMGPVGGLEVLPELRRRAPDARVIVMSTGSPEELADRSVELGALAFVQKPANVFAIPQLIERVIGAPPEPQDVLAPAPSSRALRPRRSVLAPRPAAL